MEAMLVMNEDPKVALNQAIVKETLLSQTELSTLTPEFYNLLSEHISKSNDRMVLQTKLETLKSKRKAKLLIIAGSTIPANQIEQNLTIEELELFRAIRSASKTFDVVITKPVLGQFNMASDIPQFSQ